MTDLIVIGAGPAGMAAATTAAANGLDTVLLDEQALPGGQVYRALPSGSRVTGSLGPDHARGEALRVALAASAAQVVSGHRVWNVRTGFRIDSVAEDGPRHWQAPALVVATGTTERQLPFPGWTSPGVIGLAAATILLKSHRLLPGSNVVVAGVGPLLAAVAIAILKAGGKVAAIVDAASPAEWIAKTPQLVARPDLLARGVGWLARLRAAGIRYLGSHVVTRAQGADRVDAVEIARLDHDGAPMATREVLACDSLAIGFGLVPSTDITQLLGAEHRYEAARGGWIATRDPHMRSSVPKLYVAGDGGGISGAAAAEIQGELAAYAVLRDLERVSPARHDTLARATLARHARAARFGGAMAALMAIRPALYRAIAADCVVCRCEDVRRAELDAAIAAGAGDINQLKAWTRAGMGPCQGKMCGEAVAELLAPSLGGRTAVGRFTVRPPLRPLPTAALIGSFDYSDIPIPKPAPL